MNFDSIIKIAMPHVRSSGGDRIVSIDVLPSGMGFLVNWDNSAADSDPKQALMGNTPFLVSPDGSVRGTWPFEFDHLLSAAEKCPQPILDNPLSPTPRRPQNKRYGPGFFD